MLDELILGGEIQETSKKKVLSAIQAQDSLQGVIDSFLFVLLLFFSFNFLYGRIKFLRESYAILKGFLKKILFFCCIKTGSSKKDGGGFSKLLTLTYFQIVIYIILILVATILVSDIFLVF